ncbi:type II secretion system F family protein [Stenotrophomonas sp. 24(2023)]|uniref:type II secretion system F family protein n=1 Tax=Stenotrophomonas sp. 24(2023) TaxID=3068324 RepID=UPI0027E2017C|nr:type II secretion system F family protein [Stenotrophomonas sp. 24(2023)]WMJ70172.1 type II secretion system F family protein [Stenotrophomonas sp. 24(2023)]
MLFDVRALNPQGAVQLLRMEAHDAQEARALAEAQQLFVSTVRPARTAGLRRQGSVLSLVLFSQELLALLTAGLGIVEALQALAEKETRPRTRALLEQMLAGLHEGMRLSGVLARHPQHFPPLYVGIVQAAEGTSDLPRSLARYIDYQQRVDQVRGKLVSAAIYPSILMLVGLGVSLFLMTYVVPKFAEVYQDSGRPLPWMSQQMLQWGLFVSQHPLLVAALAAMLGAVAVVAWKRLQARGGLLRLAAGWPGVGPRVHIYELSRLYLTMGMLVEGGIPIPTALRTVQPIASARLRPALQQALSAVENGMPLSEAFEQAGLTTPISLRMLRVAEHTGEMGTMLHQSALFYDGEISRWIDRFSRSFEPLLMAFIGIVVGTIVVLLYMPIFDLAGDLS